jgi:photosynthetic reaction center cytochrome c subunit/tetratricopeptide repeat protein
MRSFLPAMVFVAILSAVALPHATAQVPDKFTNLQVLPKDIAKQDLVNMMRGFSFSLGARCDFCHTEKKGGEKGLDFAADDKEEKKIARGMIRMVGGINQNYLARMGKTPAPTVQCVTCHHGLTKPRTLQAVLGETIEQKDAAAAAAQYRELRKQYYGGGQYDFGETSLNLLTESLLAQKKFKEAVAMEELNLEVNQPVSGWALHLAGQSHRANGDTEKARADYQKILAAHPDDENAKRALEELTQDKK